MSSTGIFVERSTKANINKLNNNQNMLRRDISVETEGDRLANIGERFFLTGVHFELLIAPEKDNRRHLLKMCNTTNDLNESAF